MNCAWQELLAILPGKIVPEVDRLGKEDGQEIRLRLGSPPELVRSRGVVPLTGTVDRDDLSFCINAGSGYSPWAAQTMAQGYVTAPGGHRIGICGEAVVKDRQMTGIRRVTSVCIRIARDFPGIAKDASLLEGSILLIGPPGSGKTTLLRDLVRQTAQKEFTAVVDERGELFPAQFDRACGIDVLQECSKEAGIEILLRTMGPQCIAVDEITAKADCEALVQAAWCGVRILATAHAGSMRDLRSRPLYRPLLESGIFEHILVLSRDKTWREERVA